ncbi:MAG: hypothetical protein Q9166_007306 [cf. Caloplaca sp. 2 TL-2023]
MGAKMIPEMTSKPVYQECFLDLIQSLCEVLTSLDKQIPHNHKFRIGHSEYPMALLQQRNAELLAVALVNLKVSFNNEGSIAGFLETETVVNEKYQSKNPLIQIRGGPVFDFTNVYGIQSMTIDQALALHTYVSSSQSFGPNDSLGPEAIEKATAIQRWWRVRQSLQRCLMESLEDWQMARHQILMATCPAGVTRFVLRYLLITRGWDTLAGIQDAQHRCQTLHTSIMSAFEVTTEVSEYEKLDQALMSLNNIQKSMDDAVNSVSDMKLRQIIESRQISEMRLLFDSVDMIIKQAKQRFTHIEVVLKEARKYTPP